VALTPGFLRSEAMLDHFGVSEANWQDATKKEPVARVLLPIAAESDGEEAVPMPQTVLIQ